MSSVPRATWRRIKASLAHQVASQVTTSLEASEREFRSRLDAIEAQLATVNEQVRELNHLVSNEIHSSTESTAVLGRLVRSLTERLEALETQVTTAR